MLEVVVVWSSLFLALKFLCFA